MRLTLVVLTAFSVSQCGSLAAASPDDQGANQEPGNESLSTPGTQHDNQATTQRITQGVQGSSQTTQGDSRQTQKPIIKCRDFSKLVCKDQLNRRPVDYCFHDITFGRFQCCETCSKVQPVKESSKGRYACVDQRAPDGTSYSDWCKRNVLDKPQSARISCYGPSLIQFRCMKTCKLCDQLYAHVQQSGQQGGSQNGQGTTQGAQGNQGGQGTPNANQGTEASTGAATSTQPSPSS